MLSLFQEMKINIDDMLRAGLEKHPGNSSLLEVRDWMNKLVNRTTAESSQSEDESSEREHESSKMLMLTLGDENDGSKAREDERSQMLMLADEPQAEKQTEPTLTQMFMDPAFVEEYEKIERQNQVIKINL